MPLPNGQNTARKTTLYYSISMPELYITRIDAIIEKRLPGRSRTDVAMRGIDSLEKDYRDWDRGP